QKRPASRFRVRRLDAGERQVTVSAVNPDLRSTSLSASPTPAQSFLELGVPTTLVDSLAARGITSPFPIQSATIADTLAGRDVLGRGRTGSGKTLAFSLPMVGNLTGRRAQRGRPLGLVLAPTRELASQIGATLSPLATAAGLRTTVIFGGVGQGRQVAAL